MDLNLIKKLIKIVESSEISDFAIEEGDLKVKISKSNPNNFVPQTQTVLQNPAPIQQTIVAENKPVDTPAQNKNLHEVKSPIVGTFYRAPAPDADPYAQVGDSVSPGSVLCIVEAMKLMNEIESDTGGKIVKILVDNATPVEFNQPLFLIEKD